MVAHILPAAQMIPSTLVHDAFTWSWQQHPLSHPRTRSEFAVVHPPQTVGNETSKAIATYLSINAHNSEARTGRVSGLCFSAGHFPCRKNDKLGSRPRGRLRVQQLWFGLISFQALQSPCCSYSSATGTNHSDGLASFHISLIPKKGHENAWLMGDLHTSHNTYIYIYMYRVHTYIQTDIHTYMYIYIYISKIYIYIFIYKYVS